MVVGAFNIKYIEIKGKEKYISSEIETVNLVS